MEHSIFRQSRHEWPIGHLPVSAAWKLFAEAHSSVWLPDVFNPSSYRPEPLRLSWTFTRDTVTGDVIKQIDKPDAAGLAYADSIPDRSPHSSWDRGHIQYDWEEWLRADKNAVVLTAEGHRKIHWSEIEAMRPALWTTTEASDLSRADYGPKRWLIPAIGEDFPEGVFVDEAALRLAIEGIGRRLAGHGILPPTPGGVTIPVAAMTPALAAENAEKTKATVNFTDAEFGVLEAARKLWNGGLPPKGMLAERRDEMIIAAFRDATGRFVSSRTIRSGLSKAGLIGRKSAS